MANIISIISSKGGTGKTTVALNLAVALAEQGEETLLVDTDPLGAIGLSLARSETEWSGLTEILARDLEAEEALIETRLPALSLLPRGRLDPLDVPLYEESLRQHSGLTEILPALGKRFRHIIIDTPSGLGTTTRAALAVSDFVLLPLQAESLSVRAITQTLRVLAHLKALENGALQLLGILPTMVQLQQDASFNIMRHIWELLDGVLETYIPRSNIFAEASEKGLPVSFLGGTNAPEALRFDMLATELLGIIQKLGGTTGGTDQRLQRQLV